MVEFLDAYIAKRAMLRTRWLWHIASVTPSLFVKEQLIIIVAFDGSDQFVLGHRFLHAARICKAGFIVAPIASRHARPSKVLVIACNVGIRYVLKTVSDIQVVPANGQKQVKELDQRVCLIAKPPLEALDCPYRSLAADFPQASLAGVRYLFIQKALYFGLNTRALRIDEHKTVDKGDHGQHRGHPDE